MTQVNNTALMKRLSQKAANRLAIWNAVEKGGQQETRIGDTVYQVLPVSTLPWKI
jgi:hypothetical protein